MRRDLTLHAARPHSLSAHGFEPLVPRKFLFTIPLFGFLIMRPYLSNSICLGGVLTGTARSSSTSADAFWKFSSSSIHSGSPGSSGSSGSFSLGLVQYRSTGCACVRAEWPMQWRAARLPGQHWTWAHAGEAPATFRMLAHSSRATTGDARRHAGVRATLVPRTLAASTGWNAAAPAASPATKMQRNIGLAPRGMDDCLSGAQGCPSELIKPQQRAT